MSIRLGMAIASAEIEKILASTSTIEEARELVKARRDRLRGIGKQEAAIRLREQVKQIVYDVLLDTDKGDDLDADVMPQLELMLDEELQ